MTSKLHVCRPTLRLLRNHRSIRVASSPSTVSQLLHTRANTQQLHVFNNLTNKLTSQFTRDNAVRNHLRVCGLHTSTCFHNVTESSQSVSEQLPLSSVVGTNTENVLVEISTEVPPPVVTEFVATSLAETPTAAVTEVAIPITEIPPPTVTEFTPPVAEIPSPVVTEFAPPVAEIPSPVVTEFAPLVAEIPSPVVTEFAPPVTEIPSPVVTELAAQVTETPAVTEIIPLVVQEAPKLVENTADIFGDAIQPLSSAVVDGSLASLGLGGWGTPVGWVQNLLETLHSTVGLPWWGSIMCCTVIFRFAVLPLAVKGIINNLKMAAIKPEMDRLSAIMKSSKATKNPRIRAKANNDLMALFKHHGTNPLKGLITPAVQMPLFFSFFIAIRRMAELPVPSLLDGGVLWFADLTQPDPYMVLPIISASLVWLTVEMGHTEMGPLGNNMKYLGRGMALIMLPIAYNFPAATLTYWCTTNAFTAVQSYALRQQGVKRMLGIPEPLPVPPGTKVEAPPANFKEALKKFYNDAYKKAEMKQNAKERERLTRHRLVNPPSVSEMTLYDYNPILAVDQLKNVKRRR